MDMTVERFEFQTEARQMLDLMIHSVYSNKDIFLRELISNGSDALDKLRVESLTNEKVVMPSDPKITITADRDARIISVQDNGIGMSREEIIENIGTIAKSGTREFMATLAERREQGEAVSAELIGQFGVGFYSAFMVADRMELITRRAGSEEAWKWESTGDGTYTLEEASKVEPGTIVTLHLKETSEDIDDYTSEWKIKSIVKQYSDFVSYPVTMLVEREKESEASEEGEEGAEKSSEKVVTEETLNSMKAIWRRRAEEVDEKEHNEFYHNAFYDPADPLKTIHLKAEGMQEYYALLYIPSNAPYDLYMPESVRGVQLYVKRVFIMDDAKELLPTWLRFVRGVVDSEDLPLNISREILQQNRAIRAIRNRLTKKTLETLSEMLKSDREKYLQFWNQFGPVLKEGLFQDYEYQKSILDVTLFDSTKGDGKRTLAEYIEQMPEGENDIWYLAGDDPSVVANSPHLEAFREKGQEVLLLSDRIDPVWTSSVPEYEGKKFRSVASGDVDLAGEEEKKEREEERKKKAQEHALLLTHLKEILQEEVKEVRFSGRLTSSPAIVVSDEGEINPQLEKIMRSMGQEMPKQKRVLELNPNHGVVERMGKIFEAKQDDPLLEDYAHLLYGGALIAEGEMPPDPVGYGKLVAKLMAGE
ncbi:MAG: molecular chaperone HtpG [Candidatus Kapaibacterium sp.]